MSVESSPEDYASDLVNLGEVDLAELAGLSESVLLRSLARVRREMESPRDVVAGFNSSLQARP